MLHSSTSFEGWANVCISQISIYQIYNSTTATKQLAHKCQNTANDRELCLRQRQMTDMIVRRELDKTVG